MPAAGGGRRRRGGKQQLPAWTGNGKVSLVQIFHNMSYNLFDRVFLSLSFWNVDKNTGVVLFWDSWDENITHLTFYGITFMILGLAITRRSWGSLKTRLPSCRDRLLRQPPPSSRPLKVTRPGKRFKKYRRFTNRSQSLMTGNAFCINPWAKRMVCKLCH